MKTLLLLIPFISFGQNQLEDSLIALSERMPDASFTASYRWDNHKYVYSITNKQNSATFELMSKEKLYTDYRKIGGLAYFFGTWTAMVGHSYIQKDKVYHFAAGYGVGMLTYSVTKKHRILKAVLMAAGVGILKETVYDSMMGKGIPSVKDAFWTGVGGAYGSITIPMFKIKPCKPILL